MVQGFYVLFWRTSWASALNEADESGEFSEQAVLLPAAASAKAERERVEKQYLNALHQVKVSRNIVQILGADLK